MADAMRLRGGRVDSLGDFTRFGVLTVSDRASRGEYEDHSGPAIIGFLHEAIASPWEAIYQMVPDVAGKIENALIEMADEHICSVIITTVVVKNTIRCMLINIVSE